MRIPFFWVDAFTSRAFGGNPAGVCPLEFWLPDETLQAVAKAPVPSLTMWLAGTRDNPEVTSLKKLHHLYN